MQPQEHTSDSPLSPLQPLQSINIAEERVTDQEQQQVALAAGAAVAAGGAPLLAAHNPNLTAALHLGGPTMYGGGFNASPALQQLVLQQQQMDSLGRAQSPHVGPQGHGQGMLASAALASGGFSQPPSGAGGYSTAQQQQQLAQVISLQQLAAAAAAAQQMGNPLAHPGGHQQMRLWPQGASATDMASLASSLLSGSSAGPASQMYAGALPHGQLAPEYVHHSFPQSSYPSQSTPVPAGALPFQGGAASLPLPSSAISVESQNMQSWGGLLPQAGSLSHASSLQVRQLGSAAWCVSLRACCRPPCIR